MLWALERAGPRSVAVTHFDNADGEARRRNLKPEPAGRWKRDSEEHRIDEHITIIINAVCDDLPRTLNLWRRVYRLG